jgi:hypothetical protein
LRKKLEKWLRRSALQLRRNVCYARDVAISIGCPQDSGPAMVFAFSIALILCARMPEWCRSHQSQGLTTRRHSLAVQVTLCRRVCVPLHRSAGSVCNRRFRTIASTTAPREEWGWPFLSFVSLLLHDSLEADRKRRLQTLPAERWRGTHTRRHRVTWTASEWRRVVSPCDWWLLHHSGMRAHRISAMENANTIAGPESCGQPMLMATSRA